MGRLLGFIYPPTVPASISTHIRKRVSPGAATVIRPRATSILRPPPPAVTRWLCAVASPALRGRPFVRSKNHAPVRSPRCRRRGKRRAIRALRRRVAGGLRLRALRRGLPTDDIVGAYGNGDARVPKNLSWIAARPAKHFVRLTWTGQGYLPDGQSRVLRCRFASE